MRKYLDTVSVIWDKILLHPPSIAGRLTDRKSEEQWADKVVSSTSDCQLTSKVHYTDRPEPQHDDLHSTNTLITTYESLTGTNLSPSSSPPFALSCVLCIVHISGKAKNWISLCQSDGSVLKEAKVTSKPLNFLAYCTRQATDAT